MCGARLPLALDIPQRKGASICLLTAGLVLLGLAGLIGCGRLNKSADPISSIGEINSLPENELAQGRRVELRGVITLLDPAWHLLAIQDETGGVLVDWPPLPLNVQIGDEVQVIGATSIDNHVPSVVSASARVIGKGSLPRPPAVSAASIACGNALYRFAEVEFTPGEASLGDIGHTARFSTRQSCGELLVIGRVLRRYSPVSLKGRRLRVRGVPVAFYSPAGKLDQVRLLFEDDSNVDVLDSLPTEDLPALPPGVSVLTSTSAVKALPRTEADRGYPAVVEGVVTAPANPRHDGYFIQQGSTALCIFAPKGQNVTLRSGQRVRVRGRTEKGGFAPVIRQISLDILGDSPLPAPVKIVPGDVFHGWEENLWVEVEGLVTAVTANSGRHQLELFSGTQRMAIWFSEGDSPEALSPLVNARVRITGTYSPLYTTSGILQGFIMNTPSPATVKVVEPPTTDDFRTILSLAQFDPRGTPRHRFRTAGTVSYKDSKGRLYLQDGSSSLQVVGNGWGDPPVNSWVTVEGFLSPDRAMPTIEHVRWLDVKAGTPATPTKALAESLASRDFEGRLLTVEAFLESRRTSGGELQLDLMAGRSHFTASLEAPGSQNSFPQLRPGAMLRLTGVCAPNLAQSGAGGHLANLWLRSEADIAVAQPAPWWDVQRALYAMFGTALLLVIALAWVAKLRHNLVVQMVLRSKLEEQLLHAQKLESVGRLAGGVAHDFNNYLTVVLGYTAMLLEEFPREGMVRNQLTAIREVGEKAASLTRQLLAFSRKQVLQPVPCDLNAVIRDAKSTLLPLIGEHIDIVMHLQNVEKVSIDPSQFLQVLVNLAVNARDAMPNGGKLVFETENRELGPRDVPPGDGLSPGRYVSVSISDTGTGMDRATLQRIFDPFFTTKEAGRGTGLGLAVVFGIVKQSGGHIEVKSKRGEGTRFCILLPVAETAVPAPELQPTKAQASGSETVLLVEDQAAVRLLVRSGLESHGYRVIAVASPKEALEILGDRSIAIDLLLTDLVMPQMSGRSLATEAVVIRPGIRVLFMSGYSEEVVSDKQAASDLIDYLEKPFTPSQVAAAVRRALDRTPV